MIIQYEVNQIEMSKEDVVSANILDITFSDMGFIVFLKPENWGKEEDLAVPIFIGIPEAQSIAIQFNKIRSPRPLIMDLFSNILNLMDVEITQVVISDLIEKTFYGKVYFKDAKGHEYKVDARSSDALILALRANAKIFIRKYIVEEAGILIRKENLASESEVKQSAPAKTRLEVLEEELKKAIQEERYEEAARIRDELKRNKGEIN